MAAAKEERLISLTPRVALAVLTLIKQNTIFHVITLIPRWSKNNNDNFFQPFFSFQ